MKPVGYIVVTFTFRKEGRRWTAYCEELGTATFGRSPEEAEERIKEAVVLHLNTLERVGERERFFKKHDITFYPRKPRAKKTTVTVTAPFDRETFVYPHIQPILQPAAG